MREIVAIFERNKSLEAQPKASSAESKEESKIVTEVHNPYLAPTGSKPVSQASSGDVASKIGV